jgi:hypothetical protein
VAILTDHGLRTLTPSPSDEDVVEPTLEAILKSMT